MSTQKPQRDEILRLLEQVKEQVRAGKAVRILKAGDGEVTSVEIVVARGVLAA